MARPADPTRARRGTGNRPKAGEVKSTELDVVVGEVMPEPPEDLPGDAQDMFRAVIAELWPRGLRDTDVEAVAMMCWSAYLHQEARREIAANGLMIYTVRGAAVNPLIKVARDEAAVYLRIANEFGLTLASRLRLGLMQLAGESLLNTLNDELDGPTVGVRVNV